MLFRRSVFIRDYVRNRSLLFNNFIVMVLLVHGSSGQDIAFPDDNLTTIFSRIYATMKSTTVDNEIPVTTASPQIKCGFNMFLGELDNGEKYCECVAGYIYNLETDRCYKAYTEGPCENGHHFIIQANKTMAECVPNPCKNNDEVFYKGFCHGLLLSGGPCAFNETLTISEKTHQPICERIRPETHSFIDAPPIPCAPGTRSIGRGMCRPIL